MMYIDLGDDVFYEIKDEVWHEVWYWHEVKRGVLNIVRWEVLDEVSKDIRHEVLGEVREGLEKNDVY